MQRNRTKKDKNRQRQCKGIDPLHGYDDHEDSLVTTNTVVVARKDDLHESFLAAVLASPHATPLKFSIMLTPSLCEPDDLAKQLAGHSAPVHAWEKLRLVMVGAHYLASSAYANFAAHFMGCVCICNPDRLDAISLEQAKVSDTRLVSESHLFDLACVGQAWKWRRRVIEETLDALQSLDRDFPGTEVRDFYYGIIEDNHETSFKRFYDLLRGTTTIDLVKSRGGFLRQLSAATVNSRVQEAKSVCLLVAGGLMRQTPRSSGCHRRRRPIGSSSSSGREKTNTTIDSADDDDNDNGDDDDNGEPIKDQTPSRVQVLMGCGDTAVVDTACAFASASASGVGVVICWWPSYGKTIVTICSRPESNVDAKRLAQCLCSSIKDSSTRGSTYYSEVSVPRLFFPWDKSQAAEVGWTIVDKEESNF
ncbi:hypothetical protein ml_350 [Mollivirus sibericum]|uniref:hypothetical protein n=1 Tax=Mollivirus sibericum TaxID=1678078 RepID=UPI0006B2DEBA|nr:hypothetical protein ml_350 [Mollivirus sibericum]ALD62152.1 hypothetical protein ml_350 [Mollivirus sibericum]